MYLITYYPDSARDFKHPKFQTRDRGQDWSQYQDGSGHDPSRIPKGRNYFGHKLIHHLFNK